jgi:hypothetical protein
MNTFIQAAFINFVMLKNKSMTKIEEIWKDIPTYEGLYQISNLGKVKSVKRNIIMRPRIVGQYYMIKLSRYGVNKNNLLHRLLAITFIANPEGKETVNHIDGNKLNNSICNLEWSTYSEQNKHAIKLGLKKCFGEHHSQNKLTESSVIMIRHWAKNGVIVKGANYGVSQSTIHDVIKRKSWTHI